jgi:hypothetical protein
MKKAVLAVLSVLLLAASAYLAYANANANASLSGAQEVGGGDPDGSGLASVNYSPSTNNLCVAIHVENISTPTTIPINKGAPGSNGPVVATFTGPDNGCVTVDAALGKDLKQNPDSYYVNVINADYSNGALRGQLSQH